MSQLIFRKKNNKKNYRAIFIILVFQLSKRNFLMYFGVNVSVLQDGFLQNSCAALVKEILNEIHLL